MDPVMQNDRNTNRRDLVVEIEPVAPTDRTISREIILVLCKLCGQGHKNMTLVKYMWK